MISRSTNLLGAKFLTIFCGVVAVPAILSAFSSNPPLGLSGAPGDGNCTRCHGGTAVNAGGGGVAVTFSSGATYTPGSTVHVTVKVTDSAQRLAGFELSDRLQSNTQNSAGLLVSPGSTNTAVACLNGTSPSATGCPSSGAQYIEHTSTNPIATPFTFDWQAPATDVGPVTFYVAGNAANGNGGSGGDHIYTASATLTAASTGGGGPKPAISGGVSDAFTGQLGVASSTWVAIYGTNLAPSTMTWETAPSFTQTPPKLPTSLNGVSVLVNNKPAAIYFVSSGQVNVLAPADPATGNINVTVTTANGTSDSFSVNKAALLPAFYAPFSANGKLYITAVAGDGSLLGKTGVDSRVTRGVRPGEVISLYATGFGATNPAIPTDAAFFTAAPVVNAPQITIGGQTATPVGSGFLVSPGLYQFNVTVPSGLTDGDQPVLATVNSVTTATGVVLTVQQ